MASLRLTVSKIAQRVTPAIAQHVRGMATEKQIFNQIQSTKNIKKITASMKMVSAAKLKGDEQRLSAAKKFNGWTNELSSPMKVTEDATYEELPEKCLIIPFTSEKGLCGGVNSFITRATKDCVRKLHQQGKSADVVIVGDKGRSQLRRVFSDKIMLSATEVHSPATYSFAAALTSELLAAGVEEYDAIVVIHNSFVNAAVYKQVYKVITPFTEEVKVKLGESYKFDIAKEVSVRDMYEYHLSSNLFYAFMDGAASEQSSRMTAMENASKNAGELIDSLTLRYNRARQARITTELIEIISGASALDG